MERGRIRFSGPAHELLERPDLLRAVFLARTARATAATTVPTGTPTVNAGIRPTRTASAPQPTTDAASSRRCVRTGALAESSDTAAGARTARGDPPLRRHHRGRRRRARGRSRRDRRSDRPERCRQDDDVRPDLRIPAARRRTDPPRRAPTSDVAPQPPGPARARPDVPGRPALPRSHRGRDRRRGARAVDRRPRSVNPALRSLPDRRRGDSVARRVERAARALRPRGVPRAPQLGAVDGHAPRSSSSPAPSPTSPRCCCSTSPPPASPNGRSSSSGSCCVRDPRRARLRDGRDRARHAADGGHLGPLVALEVGQVVVEGDAASGAGRSSVSSRPTSATTLAAVARSGSAPGDRRPAD